MSDRKDQIRRELNVFGYEFNNLTNTYRNIKNDTHLAEFNKKMNELIERYVERLIKLLL